ncbi:Protein of unknown function [Gryllus bimaculatus]|nr:Protein of unknown function [Gryllus bimaculatus]
MDRPHLALHKIHLSNSDRPLEALVPSISIAGGESRRVSPTRFGNGARRWRDIRYVSHEPCVDARQRVYCGRAKAFVLEEEERLRDWRRQYRRTSYVKPKKRWKENFLIHEEKKGQR